MIYTAYEVWNEVPNEDKENVAHKKQWIKLDELEKVIYKAVLGVNFEGYDMNSEKALVKMQTYIYKELKL